MLLCNRARSKLIRYKLAYWGMRFCYEQRSMNICIAWFLDARISTCFNNVFQYEATNCWLL